MATYNEQLRDAIKLILAESGEPIPVEELEQREKELFIRARALYTKTQLEMRELEVRKMEVEQHMRQLAAILTANSLAEGFKQDERDAAEESRKETK